MQSFCFVLFSIAFFSIHSQTKVGENSYKYTFRLQNAIANAIVMRWVTTHTLTCDVRKFLPKMHNSFGKGSNTNAIWKGRKKSHFAIVKLNLSMLIKIDWLFLSQIDWKSVLTSNLRDNPSLRVIENFHWKLIDWLIVVWLEHVSSA